MLLCINLSLESCRVGMYAHADGFLFSVMFYFAPRRVTFLCLHKDKVTKRKCTPASAFILCYSACRASIETRPDKPHRAWLVAELEQPMAEGSRQACVARRVRWGPEHHASTTLIGVNKRIGVFQPSKLQQRGFDEINPIPSR